MIHPLAGGEFFLKLRVHWGVGSQMNDPVPPSISFHGRGFKLGGSRTSESNEAQTRTSMNQPNAQPGGAAFQGSSYRLQD